VVRGHARTFRETAPPGVALSATRRCGNVHVLNTKLSDNSDARPTTVLRRLAPTIVQSIARFRLSAVR